MMPPLRSVFVCCVRDNGQRHVDKGKDETLVLGAAKGGVCARRSARLEPGKPPFRAKLQITKHKLSGMCV